MTNPLQENHRSKILASGLDQESVTTWINAVESIDLQNTLEGDAAKVGTLIQQGWDFCNRLPFKTKRNPLISLLGKKESFQELPICGWPVL